jgi:hypothetical protein
MANPVVESITETINTSPGSSTLTINLPGTINAGDLLLMAITTHVSWLISGWNGFTELIDDESITNTGCALAWKSASGSEGATIDITAAGTPDVFCAQVYRISNWDSGENPVADTWQNLTSDGVNPDPDSFTGWGWGADDNLFINFLWWADDEVSVTSFPSNFSDGNEETLAHNGDNESCSLGSCYLFDNASTSVNPNVWTLTGSEGVGSTIVAVLGGAGVAPIVIPVPTGPEW